MISSMETLHFGDMFFWGQDLWGVDEGAFFKDTRQTKQSTKITHSHDIVADIVRFRDCSTSNIRFQISTFSHIVLSRQTRSRKPHSSWWGSPPPVSRSPFQRYNMRCFLAVSSLSRHASIRDDEIIRLNLLHSPPTQSTSLLFELVEKSARHII